MKPHHHRAGTLFPCRFPGETGSGSGETRTRNQRLLDAVLKRLRRLPDETGPQCNPQNPLMGYEVLKRAVDAVLEAGLNALRDLSS